MNLTVAELVDFREIYGGKPEYPLLEELARMMHSGLTPDEREAARDSFPGLYALSSSLADIVVERVSVIGTRLFLHLRHKGSEVMAYICDVADECVRQHTNR